MQKCYKVPHMIEIRGYSEACESDIITDISESHAEGIKKQTTAATSQRSTLGMQLL